MVRIFTQTLFTGLLVCLVSFALNAQTTLSAGDIAFTGFHSDSPDAFSFVTLTNIASGTVIRFTDNGWKSDNTFRTGEGINVLTFTTDVSCGTEIYHALGASTMTAGGSPVGNVSGADMNFSADGDQILAYQGTEVSPTFISAVNWDGAGGAWNNTAGNSNESAIPTGLINGLTAVGHGEIDNGSYWCSQTTSGPIATMRANLNNTTHWTKSDMTGVFAINIPSGCAYSFSDCPGVPNPTALCLGDIAFTGFQSDNPDMFSFIILKDFGLGTKISFTDNGWFAVGGFRDTEQTMSLTFSVPLSCGAEVKVDGGTGMATDDSGDLVGIITGTVPSLSAEGDQIFAYQGSAPTAGAEAGFVAAIHWNGAGWNTDATSSTTSAKPCVFEDGVTSRSFNHVDNGIFGCVLIISAPTPATIRIVVNNSATWSTSNSIAFTYPPDCGYSCATCTFPMYYTAFSDVNNTCPGDPVMLSVVGVLNDATQWVWYTECCGGGTQVGTGSDITVNPTVSTTYYVRGEGGCVDVDKCQEVALTVIVDTENPMISCPADEQIDTDPGECEADYTVPMATATDNCSVESLDFRYIEVDDMDNEIGSWNSFSTNTNITLTEGRWKIQWRAKDPSGNAKRCAFFVDVVDSEPPMAVCKDLTVTFNGEDEITFLASDVYDDVNSTDNCGNVNLINFSPMSVPCEQVGSVVPVTVMVEDDNSNPDECMANVTVDGLPCGYMQGDVNCPDGNTSSSYNAATGTFELTTDCYAPGYYRPTDAHGIIKTELCGNGDIIAEVTGVTGDGWAGITMREGLGASEKMLQLLIDGSNLTRRELRTSTGGTAFAHVFQTQGKNWLRLTRNGSTFGAYHSTDGSSWQPILITQISMSNCIIVGMIATSNSPAGTVTGTFDNVSVGGVMPLSAPASPFDIAADNGVNAHDLGLFPNPASDEMTVNLRPFIEKEVLISAFNVNGQIVRQWRLDEVHDGLQRLDVNTFTNGTYMLRVESAQEVLIKKFVIARK